MKLFVYSALLLNLLRAFHEEGLAANRLVDLLYRKDILNTFGYSFFFNDGMVAAYIPNLPDGEPSYRYAKAKQYRQRVNKEIIRMY
jgi:hypothetical protein